MYYVDQCPICEAGLRGFRTCPQGHVVVLCDECEAVWISPYGNGPLFSAPPATHCPQCGSDLFDSHAHWSDTQEIGAAGWQDSVAGAWERDTAIELPPQPAGEE
jgi:hypothetical protein